jgi:hypothetical protein
MRLKVLSDAAAGEPSELAAAVATAAAFKPYICVYVRLYVHY